MNAYIGGPTRLRAFCNMSAPAQTVWDLVGDFSKPDAWMPGIREVHMQQNVRLCQTAIGPFQEQLIKMEPASCLYAILDGPLPVKNYQAVLAAKPSSSALTCLVLWESSFESKAGTDPRGPARQIALIYDAGLRSLQARFGSEDPDPLFHTDPRADVPIGIFLRNLKKG